MPHFHKLLMVGVYVNVFFIDFGNTVGGPLLVLYTAQTCPHLHLAPLHWKLFCAGGKLDEGLKTKITLQPPFDNQSNQGGVSVSGCWIVEIIMIRGHLTTKTTHRVEVLKDITTCAERLFVGWKWPYLILLSPSLRVESTIDR